MRTRWRGFDYRTQRKMMVLVTRFETALRAAACGHCELLAAPEPDVTIITPCRRHAECSGRGILIRVAVSTFGAGIQDIGIRLNQFPDIYIVLGGELSLAIVGMNQGRQKKGCTQEQHLRYWIYSQHKWPLKCVPIAPR